MLPPLVQQPTHDREENEGAVVDWLINTRVSPPPGDAMDIVTRFANPSILFLIDASAAHASNSTPNPESVEFGED